jgi:ketosteroid isomerase-like protein
MGATREEAYMNSKSRDTSPADASTLELGRLVGEYNEALSQGNAPFNIERIAHLYKRDADFMAFDLSPPNGGYAGWQSYETAWHQIMANYASFYLEANDDLRLKAVGDVAWGSFSFRVWGERQGGLPYKAEGRVTLIWVRENDKWLITHEHVSTPRSPPAPPPL